MPQNAKTMTDITEGLTNHHQRTLARIFQHPMSHNLIFREVTGLMEAIGSVDVKHNGDVGFRVRNEQISVEKPQDKDLGAEEIMVLRHFLQRAGWSPNSMTSAETAATDFDLIIVIDHAEANIYTVAAQNMMEGHLSAVVPLVTKHVAHESDPTQHDSDRDEKNPADLLFFDGIAKSCTGTGRIAIIGHGKGQSNEANHFVKYLTSHHAEIRGRVVGERIADLAHLTLPQLLDLGQVALQNGASENR